MNNLKCERCGSGGLKVTYEDERMDDILPGVVITSAVVRKCPACGNREVELPQMDGLMAKIAEMLAMKPGRLTGAEVRFLREHLQLSGVDFSTMMDSTPGTVSRWENERTPVGRHAELLLRTAVLLIFGRQLSTADYLRFAALLDQDVGSGILRLKFEGRAGWKGWRNAIEAPRAAPAMKRLAGRRR